MDRARILGERTHPRVLVLLAAYNGAAFLRDQVDSILAQRCVDVHLVISVDRSADGTEELIDRLATVDQRIQALPHGRIFGGAARNFYRLISESVMDKFDFIALADQDDVWNVDKLERACDLLRATKALGYSSNVLTWLPDGRTVRLDKAQAQRRWDYLFASAGPGCTYVLPVKSMMRFSQWLRLHRDAADAVEYHDWLLYAWVRARGEKWVIDPRPSMRYRQHDGNQLGANRGFSGAVRRIRPLIDGWYREQVLAVATCVDALDTPPIAVLTRGGWAAAIRVALTGPSLRRSWRDGVVLAAVLPLLASKKFRDH